MIFLFGAWRPDRTRKLCADDIRLIRALLAHGLSLGKVAEKFEISRTTVWRIKHGEDWGYV